MSDTVLGRRIRRSAPVVLAVPLFLGLPGIPPAGVPAAGAATLPPAPRELASLPEIRELPDPFRKPDGARVAKPEEWPAQREHLKRLVMETKYGVLPPATDLKVTGREESSDDAAVPGAVVKKIRVTIERRAGDKTTPIEAPLILTLPAKVTGRKAVIVTHDTKLDALPLLIERGFAAAAFDIFAISPNSAEKRAGIYALYPGLDCGVLAAWAWGFHRMIDYLVTREDIDPKRVAVQGFSRFGMASLVAGMLDERVALTITGGSNVGGVQPCRQHVGAGPLSKTPPSTSGGGAPSYRESDSIMRVPQKWDLWHWYAPGYRAFWGHEYRLPMDSHTAMLLCAPRALLVSEGMGDRFGYCAAVEQTVLAAQEVYRFLGAAENLGIAGHPGGHSVDWPAILDYAAWRLLGVEKKRDYGVLKYPGQDRIFSWSAPQGN